MTLPEATWSRVVRASWAPSVVLVFVLMILFWVISSDLGWMKTIPLDNNEWIKTNTQQIETNTEELTRIEKRLNAMEKAAQERLKEYQKFHENAS